MEKDHELAKKNELLEKTINMQINSEERQIKQKCEKQVKIIQNILNPGSAR
jgi:hypothetical protein